MPVFVALNHPNDKAQVNITMSPETASGTWYREVSSTATLDFENGTWLQTIYDGHPREHRQLYGPDREPLLLLKEFVPGHNSGAVDFDIEDGGGTFGTGEARWTRLEG